MQDSSQSFLDCSLIRLENLAYAHQQLWVRQDSPMPLFNGIVIVFSLFESRSLSIVIVIGWLLQVNRKVLMDIAITGEVRFHPVICKKQGDKK